jgi:hypothetical protein
VDQVTLKRQLELLGWEDVASQSHFGEEFDLVIQDVEVAKRTGFGGWTLEVHDDDGRVAGLPAPIDWRVILSSQPVIVGSWMDLAPVTAGGHDHERVRTADTGHNAVPRTLASIRYGRESVEAFATGRDAGLHVGTSCWL